MLATATATIDEFISALDSVVCFGFRMVFGKSSKAEDSWSQVITLLCRLR